MIQKRRKQTDADAMDITFIVLLIGWLIFVLAICSFCGIHNIRRSFATGTDTATMAEAAPEPKAFDVRDYFVVTNKFYYEAHDDGLGEMAANLHYFDFDTMVQQRYGEASDATCTPIECGEGDIVYDYAFSTAYWRVELCTVVEDQADRILTYIDLFDLADDSYCYASLPEAVNYRLGNYVSNMCRDTMSGENRMFQMERKAFCDFLALVKAGALDQNAVNPLEAGNIPFEKVVQPPTTDLSPAS